MNLDECYYLGYISKIHGKQGEIIITLDVDFLKECQKLESVFIQMNKTDTSLIPFFISKSQVQNNGTLRIKLDDVDEIVVAKPLVGKEVYIPSTLLPVLTGNQFYHHEVANFKIIDTNYGDVGQLNQILNFPKQAIFEVFNSDNKEILIPVAEDIIINVNRTNQTIEVNCPDGLIDLYLE
jgi:16S rRNA processing protein RimM